MTKRISSAQFSGASNVFNGVLANTLREMAQEQARRVAASLSDVTDNSAGVAAAGLVLPATFSRFTAGTGDAVAKAEFETSVGGVRDAIKEIVAQCNTIRGKVPAFDALTDSMGGTAADGTIGAIDDSMTGTDSGGALVDVDGAQTVFDVLNARMELARQYVNKLCVAAGITGLTSALTAVDPTSTFAAVSTSTGTAVGGTNATTDATVSKAQADAALDVMADNIASLAAKLNAITADANATAALTVVAV